MITTSRRSTLRLTLILGILTAFGSVSIDMYLPGLPAIGREFHADTAATQLTLSIFFIGLAVGQALYGPISDRWGRRQPLLIGCAIYALASLGCALASSIESLIALRFAQALGGCAGMVISRSVVRDLYDAQESARMYSFLMLVMGLSPIVAPLIGGQLLIIVGWRAIFWLQASFGIGCLVMVAIGLPETLPAVRRTTTGVWHALALYGRLLADRQFLGYALAGGFIFGGLFAYISGSPFVFIELYNVAPEHYGLIFGANAFGLIAASQINRWLLIRYRSDAILAAMFALAAAAGLVLVLMAITGIGGLAGLLPPLFIYIASVGLIGPNATAMAMASYGRAAGSASALFGTLQFAIGAGSGALVGSLYKGTALPMAGIIAVCGVAALITFRALINRQSLQTGAVEAGT